MFGHRPSRRNFFRGLLGALCAWPFVRLAATSAAEPAAGAPIAPTVEPGWRVGTFASDAQDWLVGATTLVYDAGVRWDTGPAPITTFTYDSLGRRYPYWPD